jgi:hypothetical protein
MLSQALSTRFSSTCCNCTRSPEIGGSVGSSSSGRLTRWPVEVASGQVEDLASDVVDLERLSLGLSALQHAAVPHDDLAGAPVGLDDRLDALRHLAEVRRRAPEVLLRRLGVDQHRGQRLVQLVGQRP